MLKLDLHPRRLAVGNVDIHYAWVIVVAASAMRLSASAVRTSFAVMLPRIVETFGWSHGMIGFGLALQWAFSGIFGPAAGWLGDRYGIRRTMLLGALVFTAAMVLTSRMTEIWQFYVYYGVFLSFALAIFQVPLTAAVTMWFQRNLGLGMGILQASQGMGPLVLVPLVLLIISWFGDSESGLMISKWVTGIQAEGQDAGLRAAFWVTGIAGGLALVILVRFFYDEPGQIELRPYGATGNEPIRRVRYGGIAQVRQTSAFWNLIGIHFWGCAGHAILMLFLVAIAEERGLSKGSAAGVFVVMSVLSTLTRFGVPIAADRFGSKGVMAVCFSMQCIPLILLFFAHDAWVFYLFAVLFGIGLGGEMSAFPIINRQYYGSAPIGTTYGWQMMGAGIGMAAGAVIGGVLRNLTGDFNVTILASFTLSAIGIAGIYLLPSTSHQLLPDWEGALPLEARSTG